ncbi:MAG: ABC transporter permease [Verrucomicrobiota bacterium]|nr:ABC transporter permease [Verrucomicrobiota bacterium]
MNNEFKHSQGHDNGELNIPKLEWKHDRGAVFINISGAWLISCNERPRVLRRWDSLLKQGADATVFNISFDDSLVWDTSLVVFLRGALQEFEKQRKEVNFEQLPHGINKLLKLSKIGKVAKEKSEIEDLTEDIEKFANDLPNYFVKPVTFIGAVLISFTELVSGKSEMRWNDFIDSARKCGASALPIVTLISFLTGLTMAFVGSVQLEKFNAKIYVADLVSLAMVREMGALMVGIIMAGRTGASFAAELGNMKLNEEIDSLRTFGVSPISFLVLPRTLALFIMTPLLTLYADIVGILGGLAVATSVMDFSAIHYFEQTQSALTHMWEIYSGVMKSLFFGLIIGLVGCYKGMNSGRDSASLGKAVTSAVVVSITFIIVTDAIFETIYSYLELR